MTVSFTGRCPLCGAQTRRPYCWAHSWAGYDNTKRGALATVLEPAEVAPKKPAVVPLTLVAGASTGSGRRLVARRSA